MTPFFVIIACFLGSLLGNAIKPLVEHAEKHRSIRRTLRDYPFGLFICTVCAKQFRKEPTPIESELS